VVAHLRPVKDPLLAARAARLVPPASRLRVVHVGAALEPDLARLARTEQSENPRYVWRGELRRGETLAAIAGAHLLAVTSRAEGGANVVAEAIVHGTPVLSTRIEGTLGMLGADYPGYFEVGDAAGLARLFQRCESEPAFYRELARACDARRSLFAPERERAAWAELLAGLG
jgi:glycosyltransferase involved in cell wall biosynthesis